MYGKSNFFEFYTFFFIRKSFGGLGLNFLKNFGHFGAKTFLRLSYFEVSLILIGHLFSCNLGQYWLKLARSADFSLSFYLRVNICSSKVLKSAFLKVRFPKLMKLVYGHFLRFGAFWPSTFLFFWPL